METREVRSDLRGASPRGAIGNARAGSGARGGSAPAANPPGGHEVVLRARESATISGVRHVSSFDDHEIMLDTDLGALTVLGHDLQIKQLDLAEGTFWVEGLVDSIVYAQSRKDDGRRGRSERGGMLGRLFR